MSYHPEAGGLDYVAESEHDISSGDVTFRFYLRGMRHLGEGVFVVRARDLIEALGGVDKVKAYANLAGAVRGGKMVDPRPLLPKRSDQ